MTKIADAAHGAVDGVVREIDRGHGPRKPFKALRAGQPDSPPLYLRARWQQFRERQLSHFAKPAIVAKMREAFYFGAAAYAATGGPEELAEIENFVQELRQRTADQRRPMS